MTPIETDPIGPIGPMGSGGRRRKPSGGVQAITMIIAWVGGAAAAVAVAFWILQYVKPDPAPEPVAVQPTVPEERRKETTPRPVRPEVVKQERKANSVETESKKSLVDQKNFQRSETPGLTYRYFEGESFGMSDFSSAAPSRSGVIVDIEDLPSANASTGLQLEGFWETKTEQSYDFVLDSTNEARLWIGGHPVADNTAQFNREPFEATRTIKPGLHKVVVEFVLSPERGSYKLTVGGTGDLQRVNLARLLKPFEVEKPKSLQGLQYELANYDVPSYGVKRLIASNREAVESGFVETVSEKSVGDGEATENRFARWRPAIGRFGD